MNSGGPTKRISATVVNPDAGSYLITGDPTEQATCLRVAQQAWIEFPYYGARYGQRGWRFTLSDSGWIATLCELSGAGADAQIRWLRELLVTRGMPSYLLECYLAQLGTALSQAVPAAAGHYAALQRGSDVLRTEREQILPDKAFHALADGFDRAVRDLPCTVASMGAVLVGAVVDETIGFAVPPGSAIAWSLDPVRFSLEWIAEVDRTIDAARSTIDG